MSSTMPSANQRWSVSLPSAKGSTAIDGRSGRRQGNRIGRRQGGGRGREAAGEADLLHQALRLRLGRDVELGLQQRREILEVLQRIRAPAAGRQGRDDEPVRVLAQVVDRKRTLRRLERARPTACVELRGRQRQGGVERQRIEPALLRPRPDRPLLFGQRDIGEERSGIELQRVIERPAPRDQPLERRNVAIDEAGANPDAIVAAHDRVLAQDAAQPHQRLAQALLRLGLGIGAPQQRHHLVARLRLGAGAGQIGEQARATCASSARSVPTGRRAGTGPNRRRRNLGSVMISGRAVMSSIWLPPLPTGCSPGTGSRRRSNGT